MKSKENEVVDLGDFGKFSKKTLIENRQKWYVGRLADRKLHSIDIPIFLKRAFDKTRDELEDEIEELERERHFRWKLRRLYYRLDRLKNAKEGLKKIAEYEHTVYEIVKSK